MLISYLWADFMWSSETISLASNRETPFKVASRSSLFEMVLGRNASLTLRIQGAVERQVELAAFRVYESQSIFRSIGRTATLKETDKQEQFNKMSSSNRCEPLVVPTQVLTISCLNNRDDSFHLGRYWSRSLLLIPHSFLRKCRVGTVRPARSGDQRLLIRESLGSLFWIFVYRFSLFVSHLLNSFRCQPQLPLERRSRFVGPERIQTQWQLNYQAVYQESR